MIVAILSTTVMPVDGIYRVVTTKTIPDIAGVPHYIGHPDTKQIIEELGAVQAATKLFKGLQPDESALCVSIKQGRSTRGDKGFSEAHQSVTQEDLDFRVLTRL